MLPPFLYLKLFDYINVYINCPLGIVFNMTAEFLAMLILNE